MAPGQWHPAAALFDPFLILLFAMVSGERFKSLDAGFDSLPIQNFAALKILENFDLHCGCEDCECNSCLSLATRTEKGLSRPYSICDAGEDQQRCSCCSSERSFHSSSSRPFSIQPLTCLQCRFVDYQPPKISALGFSHPSYPSQSLPDSLLLAVGKSNGDIDIWSPLENWVHKTVYDIRTTFLTAIDFERRTSKID
jgi:hypothetical protein